MFTRFLATVMLLLFAVSALGGVPVHAPEQGGCPLADGMESMDCCMKAQRQETTPEVIFAKLCCAIDCQGGSPLSSSTSTNLRIQAMPSSQPGGIDSTSKMPITAFMAAESVEPCITSNDDHPAYIRHLSLLI
jgi:hypothetical protein